MFPEMRSMNLKTFSKLFLIPGSVLDSNKRIGRKASSFIYSRNQLDAQLNIQSVKTSLLPLRTNLASSKKEETVKRGRFNYRRHKGGGGGGGLNLTTHLDFSGLKFLFLDRLQKPFAQLFCVC